MANFTILRLQRELLDILRNPDHQIYLHYSEDNIKHVHAMLTGPPKSPYCLGMFLLVRISMINFPDDYPVDPPKVLALTTSNGRVRFNPNIYASGKVCLSILGTWRGEPGEQWSSAHGVLSILLSIQSLMSDKPYLNEKQPGFENTTDSKVIEEYNRKIMHETLRVSICDRLEAILDIHSTTSVTSILVQKPFCTCREKSPFEDMAKRAFLLYYDIYMDVIEKEIAKGVKDGVRFAKNPFESASNTMDGTFQYASVKQRLVEIFKILTVESDTWIRSSALWISEDTTTASNLRSQSKEFEDDLTLELEDKNPFVWILTILGSLGTHFEGGMFQVKMLFHNSFPDILPRVRFLVEVFHPNITKDGVPYYTVKRPEDVRQHLTSLLRLFKRDPDSSPATHVNIRATTMFFGNAEQKRDYGRNARRCAQRSVEY
ncbi:ubiquitin-conjugating enzyme/RWD-like protein [Chytridium lagenaria]|nr:ubiquitin-conjugating enzyme/RWD-like protein [Chytridium lagenaria]